MRKLGSKNTSNSPGSGDNVLQLFCKLSWVLTFTKVPAAESIDLTPLPVIPPCPQLWMVYAWAKSCPNKGKELMSMLQLYCTVPRKLDWTEHQTGLFHVDPESLPKHQPSPDTSSYRGNKRSDMVLLHGWEPQTTLYIIEWLAGTQRSQNKLSNQIYKMNKWINVYKCYEISIFYKLYPRRIVPNP